MTSFRPSGSGHGVPSLFSTARLNQRGDRGVGCAALRSRTHPGQRRACRLQLSSPARGPRQRVSRFAACHFCRSIAPQLQVFGFVLHTHLGRVGFRVVGLELQRLVRGIVWPPRT